MFRWFSTRCIISCNDEELLIGPRRMPYTGGAEKNRRNVEGATVPMVTNGM
jgi:hypothetical protein